MTKQEFINLPATRKGLKILETEFLKSNEVFFNEVSRSLRTHLQLPTAVKSTIGKFNFSKALLRYEKIQEQGYRKDLNIPLS